LRVKRIAASLTAAIALMSTIAQAHAATVQPRSAYARSSVDNAQHPKRIYFTDRRGHKDVIATVCGRRTTINFDGGILSHDFVSDDGRWVIVGTNTTGHPNGETWLVYRPAGRIIARSDFPAVFGRPGPTIYDPYSFADAAIPQLHYLIAPSNPNAIRLSLPRVPRRLPARTCIPDA
jgi:hypothetical protein